MTNIDPAIVKAALDECFSEVGGIGSEPLARALERQMRTENGQLRAVIKACADTLDDWNQPPDESLVVASVVRHLRAALAPSDGTP